MTRGTSGVALAAALVWLMTGVTSSQTLSAAPASNPVDVAPPPSIAFEESAVVVSGATPGGSLVVFGVSRGFNGFTGYVLRHDHVVTTDRAGTARVELALPVALRSVWSAVDVGTGGVGVATPEGFELRHAELPRERIGSDGRSLVERRRSVDALWVRPGASGPGAWGARFGDGGTTDADGIEDRSIRALVSSFLPVDAGGSPPPGRLAAGDVLVVIDSETLEIATARLAG